MKCPLCNLEMRITKSKNVVENDDTPNEPTKLFIIQELTCVNKNCPNYNKVVDSVKDELPLG